MLSPPAAARSPVLSLVSCFAGGVFLGTCLLDLLPDYLASISAALEGLRVTVSARDPPAGLTPPRTLPRGTAALPRGVLGVPVPGIGVSSSGWVWGGSGMLGQRGGGQLGQDGGDGTRGKGDGWDRLVVGDSVVGDSRNGMVGREMSGWDGGEGDGWDKMVGMGQEGRGTVGTGLVGMGQ